MYFFFFQAEDGIRDVAVTGVQTCALPICIGQHRAELAEGEGAQQCQDAPQKPDEQSHAQVSAGLTHYRAWYREDPRADRCTDHDENQIAEREDAGELARRRRRGHRQSCAAMAAATSRVPAVPPISGVRTSAASVARTACSRSRAAPGAPRCSSISAPVSTAAIGLAIPLPASDGAEPCTGSNNPAPPRPGWRLALAASPSPPTSAAPRSDRMSPYRLLVTITWKRSGSRTSSIASSST